jgi:ABC-type glycerol-3-phosphate transport system substrate-binding protein
MFDPLTVIYQHGGHIFDDLQNPTRTTFDDPLNVEALEWYVRLIYDYNVAPTPEQMQESFGQRGGLQGGILSGRVGMWTGMLSERGGQTWPTEWDMRWGVVPLPRDALSATLTLVEGYFVSAQTEHPDACWKWLSFLSDQLPARQFPVRRSLATSVEYERQVGEELASVARSSMENALLLSPRLAEFEQALEVFSQAFNAILDERSTPHEAMSWAQQRSNFK